MLDDFLKEQPIAYKTLKNVINLNKISHAYIIETNGYQNSWNFVKSMAKCFLCPKNYSNLLNCGGCNQCLKIDNDEFTELKVIDTDSQWIKKSQLDELQEEFSKKAIIGNKKVYILKNAEKLNISSSNSLLKFLEEPEEGIIAILMVENRFMLLDTIVSRCQVISLNNRSSSIEKSTLEKVATTLFDSKEMIKEYLENVNSLEKIEKVLEFVEFYEKNHLNTIIYLNKIWHESFKEKDEIYNALYIMAIIYKDILNYILGSKIEYFNDYEDRLISICGRNTKEDVLRKIRIITEIKDNIKYNINTNLAMDKLIIGLEDVIVND